MGKSKNDRQACERQYGGFVKNKATGEYDLLFTTYISNMLARDRAVGTAKTKNTYQKEQYDVNDVIVKVRNVRTIYDNWKQTDTAV